VPAGDYEAELQRCVDYINEFRAAHGRSALSRSGDLEQCAAEGAYQDSLSGAAHGHFGNTDGCGGVSDAENEVPGWSLSWSGSVMSVVEGGIDMMMDEGPGGGHYENILGDHNSVGCGIFITPDSNVWVIQDFR